MKNKAITIVTICSLITFLPNSLLSQNITYSKIISTPMDESIKDVIEDSLGNLFYVGYNASPGQFKHKTNGFVLSTNKIGEITDSTTTSYTFKSIEYFNAFFDDFGNIDITGYSSTDLNSPHLSSKIELVKLTNELENINSNSITLPDTYGLQHLRTRRGFNNDFIFVSYVWYASDFLFNPIFLKANSNFDSLTFNINLDVGYYGEDIKQLENNKYWFISATGDISILDSLFQPTGKFGQLSHELNASYGTKWDTDTSFFLVGSDWYLGPDDVGFVKQNNPIDSSNSIFNYITTPDTNNYPAEYGGLDFNNKDSIFIGGTKNYSGLPFMELPSWYFILQTDSLLNIRWERFYGGDAYYVMTKLKATKDGGCIAIGDRYDFKNTNKEERDIYILKLNNQGLLTSTGENQSNLMHEAIVFPNPGTNKFNIRVAAQHPESTVELYNINGELILKNEIIGKKATIETSFLENGTYIYKIFNKNGLFETGKWIKN